MIEQYLYGRSSRSFTNADGFKVKTGYGYIGASSENLLPKSHSKISDAIDTQRSFVESLLGELDLPLDYPYFSRVSVGKDGRALFQQGARIGANKFSDNDRSGSIEHGYLLDSETAVSNSPRQWLDAMPQLNTQSVSEIKREGLSFKAIDPSELKRSSEYRSMESVANDLGFSNKESFSEMLHTISDVTDLQRKHVLIGMDFSDKSPGNTWEKQKDVLEQIYASLPEEKRKILGFSSFDDGAGHIDGVHVSFMDKKFIQEKDGKITINGKKPDRSIFAIVKDGKVIRSDGSTYNATSNEIDDFVNQVWNASSEEERDRIIQGDSKKDMLSSSDPESSKVDIPSEPQLEQNNVMSQEEIEALMTSSTDEPRSKPKYTMEEIESVMMGNTTFEEIDASHSQQSVKPKPDIQSELHTESKGMPEEEVNRLMTNMFGSDWNSESNTQSKSENISVQKEHIEQASKPQVEPEPKMMSQEEIEFLMSGKATPYDELSMIYSKGDGGLTARKIKDLAISHPNVDNDKIDALFDFIIKQENLYNKAQNITDSISSHRTSIGDWDRITRKNYEKYSKYAEDTKPIFDMSQEELLNVFDTGIINPSSSVSEHQNIFELVDELDNLRKKSKNGEISREDAEDLLLKYIKDPKSEPEIESETTNTTTSEEPVNQPSEPIFATDEELKSHEEQFYGSEESSDDFYQDLYDNQDLEDNNFQVQQEPEVEPSKPIEEDIDYKEPDFASDRELKEYEEKIYGKSSEQTESDRVEDFYQDLYEEQASNNNDQIQKEIESAREFDGIDNEIDDAISANKSFFSTKTGQIATAVALGAVAIANRGKRRRLEQKRLNSAETNKKRLQAQQTRPQMTPDMYRQEAIRTAQEISIQDTTPAQRRYNTYYDTTSAQLAASISQYRYGARMPGYLT